MTVYISSVTRPWAQPRTGEIIFGASLCIQRTHGMFLLFFCDTLYNSRRRFHYTVYLKRELLRNAGENICNFHNIYQNHALLFEFSYILHAITCISHVVNRHIITYNLYVVNMLGGKYDTGQAIKILSNSTKNDAT